MEQAANDGAQTASFKGMKGFRCSTIQRTVTESCIFAESFVEGVPLFKLNGDSVFSLRNTLQINGTGMVYNSSTQSYETESLAPLVTEEDRGLAATLVTVELQQQQKQQQIYINRSSDSSLKQQCRKNIIKENIRSQQVSASSEINSKYQGNVFECELCKTKFNDQLQFFEHLKLHYEPVKEKTIIANKPVNNPGTIALPNVPLLSVDNVENALEEFSEFSEYSEFNEFSEHIMGIRVDETESQIDDKFEAVDKDVLAESNRLLSSISEEPQEVKKDKLQDQFVTNEEKFFESKKSTDELICPNCDRTFDYKSTLLYHIRSHSGERPHQCEVCDKSFAAASALKVHKRIHTGIKPYKCEDCGHSFRQWCDLKYHFTSLHSEQRQFQCEYCGKDFARKYSLTVHRRIHTGEKNYKCDYCNKTFSTSCYLQTHRKIHTGEKLHPCDVCSKAFRTRSDMNRHILTHSRTNKRVIHG